MKKNQVIQYTKGVKLGEGDVLRTLTGRHTSPFPKCKFGPRQSARTLRAVDTWLIQNALDEAKFRNDEFNVLQFSAVLGRPSQADKDAAELYLFEFQPIVPLPFLRPLIGTNS